MHIFVDSILSVTNVTNGVCVCYYDLSSFYSFVLESTDTNKYGIR